MAADSRVSFDALRNQISRRASRERRLDIAKWTPLPRVVAGDLLWLVAALLCGGTLWWVFQRVSAGQLDRRGMLSAAIFGAAAMASCCYWRFRRSKFWVLRLTILVAICEVLMASLVIYFSGARVTDAFFLRWLATLNVVFVGPMILATGIARIVNRSSRE